MITIKQLTPALINIGAQADKAEQAAALLQELLSELDEIEVKGRQNVDTLLGCMMAIEAIIGEENNGE